jgi:hypothetical protein
VNARAFPTRSKVAAKAQLRHHLIGCERHIRTRASSRRDKAETASHNHRTTPATIMHYRRFPNLLFVLLLITSALSAVAQPSRRDSSHESPVGAAPPDATIDLYPVTTARQKGGRYINTRFLPGLGYVGAAPSLQIKRLLSLKKIHTNVSREVQSADGKTRIVSNAVPALQGRVSNADARAIADLMHRSLGQRIYIEAGGKAVYAPLVRKVRSTTTFTFTLSDDAQLEDVYQSLAPFVKK